MQGSSTVNTRVYIAHPRFENADSYAQSADYLYVASYVSGYLYMGRLRSWRFFQLLQKYCLLSILLYVSFFLHETRRRLHLA